MQNLFVKKVKKAKIALITSFILLLTISSSNNNSTNINIRNNSNCNNIISNSNNNERNISRKIKNYGTNCITKIYKKTPIINQESFLWGTVALASLLMIFMDYLAEIDQVLA